MKVKTAVAGAGLVLAVAGPYGSSSAEDVAPPQPPEAQPARVVRVEVKRPPRVVHMRVRLRVPRAPSPAYVEGTIAAHEAALWGASYETLRRRIECESHGDWWASNGQYLGVGQFARGTFDRGLSTIGTRRVVLREVTHRRMRSRVYRHWSDGRVDRRPGRTVRQRVVVRRVGRLSGAYPDAWTEVRIMAQANAGRSSVRDSEWSCR